MGGAISEPGPGSSLVRSRAHSSGQEPTIFRTQARSFSDRRPKRSLGRSPPPVANGQGASESRPARGPRLTACGQMGAGRRWPLGDMRKPLARSQNGGAPSHVSGAGDLPRQVVKASTVRRPLRADPGRRQTPLGVRSPAQAGRRARASGPRRPAPAGRRQGLARAAGSGRRRRTAAHRLVGSVPTADLAPS